MACLTEPTESWPKSEQMEARRRGDNLEVKSMRHCKHLGCFSFEKWLGQTLFFKPVFGIMKPQEMKCSFGAHPHTLTSQSAALKLKSPSSKQKVAYTRPLCCPYVTLLLLSFEKMSLMNGIRGIVCCVHVSLYKSLHFNVVRMIQRKHRDTESAR